VVWYTFGVWRDWQLQSGSSSTSTATTSSSSGPSRVEAVSTLRDRTPQPQPDPLEEAQVIWGKPSSFSWGSRAGAFQSDPIPQSSFGGVTWPEDPENEQEQDLSALVFEWTEVARLERDVRINGPDGAYVDFKRVDELVWQLPPTPEGRQVFVHQKFKVFGDEA